MTSQLVLLTLMTVLSFNQTTPSQLRQALDNMASTAQVPQPIGGGSGLSLAAELAVQQSVVFPAGRLQSVWNNDLGAPTYIGGPGFAIGSFDISQDGTQLASSLLQQWNFLGIDDPRVELRLLRDTSSASQRTLVFQQTSGGIPVHQSRIFLTFSTAGKFLYYGGRYVPADKQSGWGFASTCGQLLGTADQLGWSIIECQPIFYLPDDVLQDPNGGMTLMPVFALESMAPWARYGGCFCRTSTSPFSQARITMSSPIDASRSGLRTIRTTRIGTTTAGTAGVSG